MEIRVSRDHHTLIQTLLNQNISFSYPKLNQDFPHHLLTWIDNLCVKVAHYGVESLDVNIECNVHAWLDCHHSCLKFNENIDTFP